MKAAFAIMDQKSENNKGAHHAPSGRRRTQGSFLRPRRRNVYGAVDLGTNNCRLLVAIPTREGFKVIDAFSRIVRLGEGLDDGGELSEDAIGRTISALKICAEKMQRQGVTHMRAVATHACREASNCDIFLRRVKQETNLDLDIIAPSEEARLAVMGCKALLDQRYSRGLVFDIGGGSTELIWIEIGQGGQPKIIDWTSIPFGVVNLSEKFGTRERLKDGEFNEMKTIVADALHDFDGKNDMTGAIARNDVQLLGTSGTVTTLTSMDLNLAQYDRSKVDGAWVTRVRMKELCLKLAGMDYEERVALGSIGADRAELVVSGCAILDAIMDLWPIADICVADRGIREGMLLDLMGPPRKKRRRRRRRRKSPRNEQQQNNYD